MVGYAHSEQSGGGTGALHLSCGKWRKRAHREVRGDTMIVKNITIVNHFTLNAIIIMLLVYSVRSVGWVTGTVSH